jgi:hypothetical protein
MKPSFLLLLLLNPFSAEFLLANGSGPSAAVNGVFGSAGTCAQSGCHSGRQVNSDRAGFISILGLPTEWAAGQVYPLTVMVARPGAVNYGFQLSSVVDSANTQGGTLTSAGTRVQVISGGGLQFAEHNAAAAATPSNGNFTLLWQAPSDPTVGNVRFDIAANAGYGDAPANDYIYTQRLTVSAPDLAPSSATRPYSVSNFSIDSSHTVGSSSSAKAGFARILPDTGNTTPSGLAIFGLRQNNALVSETGVPASTLIRSCRIYAEENGPLKTGVAIANPGTQAATINFYFTKADGTDFGAGSTKVPAGGQIASFLDQAPFNSGAGLQGTFTFTSTMPVAVIALRGLTNERGEFLMTTLPVIDTTITPVNAPVLLPYFADGGGWKTSVILVNPTDNTLTGTAQFLNSMGAASPLSKFTYSIARRSSFKLVTSGQGSSTLSGSLLITPDTKSVAPTALNVFSYKPAAITVSEAGVVPYVGTALRMYVETSGLPGDALSIQSGIAVANPYPSTASLTLTLFQPNGNSTGLVSTLNVPGQGQIAKFLSDIFPSLVPPFVGLVQVTTNTPGIAAFGLRGRYNERSDFLITTTPPIDEGSPQSSAEFDFPHFVNGGGYTTQFILFSGTGGQSGTGNLNFFAQDGTALPLTLAP